MDAAGFSRNDEEGYTDTFTARRLYELFAGDPKDVLFGFKPGFNFWNPGAVGERNWLLPIPRQFNPRWFADSRQLYHTLGKNFWTYAPNTQVLSFVPTDKNFTGSTPSNEWISIYAQSTAVSLDNTNFSAMATAAGITLPANMKTLAICGHTPAATPLGDAEHSDFTPFIQFANYPSPDNAFVFGWSHFAVIMFGRGGYLLRDLTGAKQSWQLVAKWNLFHTDQSFETLSHSANFTELGTVVKADIHGLLVAQLGDEDLWLQKMGAGGVRVKWKTKPTEFNMPAGAWWVAGAPDQKLDFHAEVVGYEVVDTAGNNPLLFALPAAPTLEPDYEMVAVFHRRPTENIVSSHGFGGWTLSCASSGESINFELENYDDPTLEFHSDGHMYRGSFFLGMVPNNPGLINAGYVTPMIKLFELGFPPKISLRPHNELILYDDQYEKWSVEAGMYDPAHGQCKIQLQEWATSTLEDNGFHERFGFPVVYEELFTDELGLTSWKLCWVAWAETVEVAEETVESLVANVGLPGVRRYTIKMKPLLHRANQKYSALPRLNNPTGEGFIEHTYAVGKTLNSAGWNLTDPQQYYVYPDRWEGTARSRLPGTWGHHTSKGDEGDEDAWGPTWSETKLQYCLRVARKWSVWCLYNQLSGLTLYHPDLLVGFERQEFYFFPGFALFRDSIEAVANGIRPDQIYSDYLGGDPLEGEIIRPKWNVFSVYGKDDNENTVKAIAFDDSAIDNLSDPNFSGEKNPESVVERMAVGTQALNQMCAQALRRGHRKRVVRKFAVGLAPWELQGVVPFSFDVGQGFYAAGRGFFVCIHLQTELIHRGIYQTVITGERIPDNALTGVTYGVFPGQGEPPLGE